MSMIQCKLPDVACQRETNYRETGPPVIRTPLLPNNHVLIRDVAFGEREY